MTNTEKIISTAKKYLHQVELPGNKFDINTELGRLLKDAGHRDGESWCCYFTEGVFCEALPASTSWFRKYFSANCKKTYENFVKAGITPHMDPRPGDLAIYTNWKNGVELETGHAGIVVIYAPTIYHNVEGNTNNNGSTNGNEVLLKRRLINNTPPPTGLRLKGFLTLHSDK